MQFGKDPRRDFAAPPRRTQHGSGESTNGGALFVFGAPRSGTTWLAKIFDSHPDVLYRHEPDSLLRDENLPNVCTGEDVVRYRDRARKYLARLAAVRTLKSSGSLPVFPKNYRRPVEQKFREAIIYGSRAATYAFGERSWPSRIPVPDIVAETYPTTIVLKSVSSCGRARLFAEAAPESKFIFILRHPCGQVSSMLRGVALGKFDPVFSAEEIMRTPVARRMGLTLEILERATLTEKLAWNWSILNQQVLDEFLGSANFRMIRYGDLCDDPTRVAKELFNFAGLNWNPQTATFVEKSASYDGPDQYYQVLKNSRKIADKWRTQLPVSEQKRILDIAATVEAGRLFTP